MSMPARFRTMLYVQWKLQRAELLGFTLLTALIAPLSIWPGIGSSIDAMRSNPMYIDRGMLIRTGGALLAVCIGAVLAVRPFFLDARVRHTYALALPTPRSHFALMRAGSGILLSLMPAAGFLIGCIIAAQILPDTLTIRSYSVELTVRFFLAMLMAFAVFFGLQYGLGGRARRWVLISAFTVLGVEVFTQFTLRSSVITPVAEMLAGSLSPLRIYLDRWVLFDV